MCDTDEDDFIAVGVECQMGGGGGGSPQIPENDEEEDETHTILSRPMFAASGAD